MADSPDTTEEWRTIAIAPAYEVSSLGRVRRVVPDKMGRAPGILKQALNSTGRAQVSLCADGRIFSAKVHRLVAAAFLKAPMVCHRDGDPLNNVPSNLYWGDARQNARDMVEHGRARRGVGNGNAKLTEEQVRFIRTDPRTATALSKVLPVTLSTICRVRRNETHCASS